jgi:hypothetical protein
MPDAVFKHERSPPGTPILSAPYRTTERGLFRARLRLYVDRLELSGWRWWRRVHREIPLPQVSRVEAPEETTLRVRPRDRDPLSLQIENAERWARAIRSFRTCLDGSDSLTN